VCILCLHRCINKQIGHISMYIFRIVTFFSNTPIEGVHSHFDIRGNLLFNQLATLNLEVFFSVHKVFKLPVSHIPVDPTLAVRVPVSLSCCGPIHSSAFSPQELASPITL